MIGVKFFYGGMLVIFGSRLHDNTTNVIIVISLQEVNTFSNKLVYQ